MCCRQQKLWYPLIWAQGYTNNLPQDKRRQGWITHRLLLGKPTCTLTHIGEWKPKPHSLVLKARRGSYCSTEVGRERNDSWTWCWQIFFLSPLPTTGQPCGSHRELPCGASEYTSWHQLSCSHLQNTIKIWHWLCLLEIAHEKASVCSQLV